MKSLGPVNSTPKPHGLKVLGQPEQPMDTTASPGAAKKPDWCFNNCPRATIGSGFVPDWVPEKPKIAFFFSHPAKDDVGEREPLRGGMGRYFWASVGRATGLTKEDVILSNVLRCYTWQYPVGKETKIMEHACRHWDNFQGNGSIPVPGKRSLVTWKPNLFIPTFGLDKMIEIGAFEALAIADIKKALRFAEEGYRPVVLMGTEAMGVAAPWLGGGMKNWRGTWWEGDWRFAKTITGAEVKALSKIKTFEPVTYDRPWVRKYYASKKAAPKPAKQESLFG